MFNKQKLDLFDPRKDRRRMILIIIFVFIFLLLGVSGYLAYTIINRNVNPDDTAASYCRLCSQQYVNLEIINRGLTNKKAEYDSCMNECLTTTCTQQDESQRSTCQNESGWNVCNNIKCQYIKQTVDGLQASYDIANKNLQDCIAQNCPLPNDPSRIPTRLPGPTTMQPTANANGNSNGQPTITSPSTGGNSGGSNSSNRPPSQNNPPTQNPPSQNNPNPLDTLPCDQISYAQCPSNRCLPIRCDDGNNKCAPPGTRAENVCNQRCHDRFCSVGEYCAGQSAQGQGVCCRVNQDCSSQLAGGNTGGGGSSNTGGTSGSSSAPRPGGGTSGSGGSSAGGTAGGTASIPMPSGLTYRCDLAARKATIQWNGVSGATYAVRVDNLKNGWSGNCQNPNQGDYCVDNHPNVSYTFDLETRSMLQFKAWVHALTNQGLSNPIEITFDCLANIRRPHCESFTVTGGSVVNGRRVLRPGESLNITMVVKNPLDRGRGWIFPYNMENLYPPPPENNPRGAWLPQTNVSGATPMSKLLDSDTGYRWIVNGTSATDTITFSYVIHYDQLNKPDLNNENTNVWQPGRTLRKVALRGFGGELFGLGPDGFAARLTDGPNGQVCSVLVDLESATPTPTPIPLSQCTGITVTNTRNNASCTPTNPSQCQVRQGDVLNVQIQGTGNVQGYLLNQIYAKLDNTQSTVSMPKQSSSNFSFQVPTNTTYGAMRIAGYTTNNVQDNTSNDCQIAFTFSLSGTIEMAVDTAGSTNLNANGLVDSTSIVKFNTKIVNNGTAMYPNIILVAKVTSFDPTNGNPISPVNADIVQATNLTRSGGTISPQSTVSPAVIYNESGGTIATNPGNNYTPSQSVKSVAWAKVNLVAPGEEFAGSYSIDIGNYSGTPGFKVKTCAYGSNDDNYDSSDTELRCLEMTLRTAAANYIIQKSVNKFTAGVGETLTYTLKIINTGSSNLDLSTMSVVDTISGIDMSKITVSNISNSGTVTGNTINWTSANLVAANGGNNVLAPSGQITLTYNVIINNNFFTGSSQCTVRFSNQARATSQSLNIQETSELVNVDVIRACVTTTPVSNSTSTPTPTTSGGGSSGGSEGTGGKNLPNTNSVINSLFWIAVLLFTGTGIYWYMNRREFGLDIRVRKRKNL